MIRLRFGHLCDYATQGERGKLILVGIFENFYAAAQGPVGLPPFWMVIGLECSVGDGSRHVIAIRLLDGDGKTVIDGMHDPEPRQFVPAGPGQPLRIQALIQVAGAAVPGIGDYEFEIRVDGTNVGSVSLGVLPMPGAPANG